MTVHREEALTVPASEIVKDWFAEMEIRRSLTPQQRVERLAAQRRERERQISEAIGRPYRIEDDY